MSRGITPRFTTWCPEPTTPLGRDNPDGAPLEYHVRLLEAYRDGARAARPRAAPGLRRRRAPATPSSRSARSWTRSTPDEVTVEEAVPCVSRISVDEARGSGTRERRGAAGARAGACAARYHEPDRATYMVMRIINYTNVCVAQCDYCAFYVLPNQDGGYVLSRDDVFAKIDELVEFGGDLVAFNGGFNPKLPLDYYCDLFAAVRERYGDRVEFYALTIAEFVFLADRAGALVRRGGGAAARRRRPLGHGRRQRDPHRGLPEAAREVEVHGRATTSRRSARSSRAGLRTTATMVIGFDETLDERLEHLQRTRDFQDETGRASSRSSAGRTSRTAPPSAAGRSRRRSTAATSRSRGSSSTTSSTSAPRC